MLFLHGYKGYMDWGAWALVGDHFASQGWRFLRINFSHNGTTPSRPTEFTDLDAFAANTYSRELDEATDVLRALRTPGSTEESQRVASMPLAETPPPLLLPPPPPPPPLPPLLWPGAWPQQRPPLRELRRSPDTCHELLP